MSLRILLKGAISYNGIHWGWNIGIGTVAFGSFYSDGQAKRFIGTCVGIDELASKYFISQI